MFGARKPWQDKQYKYLWVYSFLVAGKYKAVGLDATGGIGELMGVYTGDGDFFGRYNCPMNKEKAYHQMCRALTVFWDGCPGVYLNKNKIDKRIAKTLQLMADVDPSIVRDAILPDVKQGDNVRAGNLGSGYPSNAGNVGVALSEEKRIEKEQYQRFIQERVQRMLNSDTVYERQSAKDALDAINRASEMNKKMNQKDEDEN